MQKNERIQLTERGACIESDHKKLPVLIPIGITLFPFQKCNICVCFLYGGYKGKLKYCIITKFIMHPKILFHVSFFDPKIELKT